MDYLQFRQTPSQGSAVSVNHKALITRALTKYPIDFALFRELLQNSADAQAKAASIRFETSSTDESVSKIHGLPINRLTFSNDGLDFNEGDWNRLREIASGNPNETKIGAFGVGFYSVFELTEEPLVHSGNQIMNFKYKGVQLEYHFTEKAPCYQKGTLIDLPYKNQGQLPDLVKFIGFLVQSFLLISLKEVNLQLKYGNKNVVNLLSLSKGSGTAKMLVPPSDCQLRSPQKMLKVNKIESTPLSITLKYLNVTQMPPLTMSKGLFSFGAQLVSSLVTSTGDPSDHTVVTCTLTKVDAVLDVNLSTKFRNHMVETLLKPPPKQAVISLLSFDGSAESREIGNQLKAYIFPKSHNDAKVFIGFPTKQSTGLKSHLALNQIIPTMERTAVDMSNQFVKDWNTEMLYMAGLMARCTYETELSLCHARGDDAQDSAFIVSRFKISASAPDPLIGLYIKEGFWKCSKFTLVPTTKGILPNTQVRVAHAAQKIIRTTPLILDIDLANELLNLDLVQKITLREIAADVGSSPLNLELARRYAVWLAHRWADLNPTSQTLLLSAFFLKHTSGDLYDLSPPLLYCDRSKLPDTEVATHLPPKCLPNDIAQEIGLSELTTLGMIPLSLEDWTKFRFQSLEIAGPSEAALIIHGILQVSSKAWSRLSTKSRNTMKELFDRVPCVPTQAGIVRPSEAYIREIKIFPHLPVVNPQLELPISWLKEIGVRESIDMTFVLAALTGEKLQWKNEDLVSHLEENSSSLQRSDWEVLKSGRFFAKEGEDKKLYMANQLFAPDDSLRKLGLPILSYRGWSDPSKISSLMFAIGLRKYPRPEEFMADPKSFAACQIALRYFVRHYEEARYNFMQIKDFKIVPTASENHELEKAQNCFRDAEMKAFGKQVIDPQWEPAAARLGVRRHPKISDLVKLVLSDPPRFFSEKSNCETIFAFFAQNADSLGDKELRAFQETSFIPIYSSTGVSSWEKPESVFLPQDGQQDYEIEKLRPLLVTLHLDRKALPFLYLVGVKSRPSLIQILELVLKHPTSVFALLRDGDIYEELLVKFESKWEQIAHRPDLISAMRTVPFLLGVSYLKSTETDILLSKGQISLYPASQIAVIDDISIFNHFKEKIVTAPQVEEIERLYYRIGVPKLSRLLQESIKIGSSVVDETRRVELQSRIDERVQLFLDHTSKQVNPNYIPVEVSLVRSLELTRKLHNLSAISTRISAYIHPKNPTQILVAPSDRFDWIDVAAALSRLVLLRPDQDSVVVLEIQLSSDLQSLERKGYNIERIRRQKGLATLEKKKPVLKFDDEKQPPPNFGVQKHNNSANLTLSDAQNHSQMLQSVMGENDLKRQQLPNAQPSSPSHAQTPMDRSGRKETRVESSKPGLFDKLQRQFRDVLQKQGAQLNTRSLSSRDQLSLGLKKAKPFSASDLSAPQHVDAPAPIKESECTSPRKIHDLQCISSTESGIRIFTTSSHPKPSQDELFLGEALVLLCRVYNYPVSAVHLYRDQDVSSIAFNYNGSIFFNTCVQPSTESILDYYYPVMAHEIAHNLVSSHGASHSFYAESYIQSTLSEYAAAAKQI